MITNSFLPLGHGLLFTILDTYGHAMESHDLQPCTQMQEEKLQTSVLCRCYFVLVEYLAMAGLMNFLAQSSNRIHNFTVDYLMPLAFLTKLSNMH